MGLAKILVAQDGTGLYFLKILVNFLQYRGTVGLLNSRSIVNRSKVNNFVTSNYRNNTYIACSLIFVNKIFLFLSLLSVLIFLKIMYQKQRAVLCCDFIFLHHFTNSICLFSVF